MLAKTEERTRSAEGIERKGGREEKEEGES